MSRLFTFPLKDASIYQGLPLVNAGLDEILEIGKGPLTSSFPPSQNLIRTLLQFDVTAISSSYANGSMNLNALHYLNLKLAKASGLQQGQQIVFYIASQSWQEGTGYSVQTNWNPQDGVTWLQRDNIGDSWPSGGGGTFYTASAPTYFTSSVTFQYPPQDIRLDVTQFITNWVSGTFENDGFLIKLPDTDEFNSLNMANIRIYSNQTHTIFKPTLESVWYNQTFITGTLYNASPVEVVAILQNLNSEYYSGSFNRINVGVRDVNPLKTYDTIYTFGPRYYFPTSSYYAVVDTETNVFVVPFDSGSLVNCDTSGSYFILDTQNLYPNRYYKILLRVDTNGTSKIFDPSGIFRVKSWL